MFYSPVYDIEYDLNTVCNSVCPTCHRYTEQDGELYLNPLVTFNHQMPLEIFEKSLQSPRIAGDHRIKFAFVGSVGEPIAHPNFLEIVDLVYKYCPNARINIHTNGGLKNKNFYAELGKKLRPDSHVQFSIDGLEDTNGIYRRNVIWSKTMENMQAFIDAGGKAIWNFIVFPWNQHQIPEAREIALSKGCASFEILPDREPRDHLLKNVKAAENKTHTTVAEIRETYPITLAKEKYGPIKDRCISIDSVYVNAFGKVVPCCMFNVGQSDPYFNEEITRFMYTNNEHWNDLSQYDMETILTDPWWDNLKESFDETPCSVCLGSCAKKLDK